MYYRIIFKNYKHKFLISVMFNFIFFMKNVNRNIITRQLTAFILSPNYLILYPISEKYNDLCS